MATTLKKNKQGYGYKYTELSEINNYIEELGERYIQFIKRIETEDYIFTQRYKLTKDNLEPIGEPIQGCRVVQAILSGKSNPAQEQGSALTYARRYSLLMAYGLACEDDDAESLTRPQTNVKQNATSSEPVYVQNIRKFIKENNIAVSKVQTELMKLKKTKLIEIEQEKATDFMKSLLSKEGEK